MKEDVEKMRGEVGEKIEMKIMRKGEEKKIKIKINREIIKVKEVR